MQIPNTLTSNPSIIAAAASGPTETSFHGPASWHDILRSSMALMAFTVEPFIKVVLGRHIVLVERAGDGLVAVLTAIGDPISKSLRRMVRKGTGRPRQAAKLKPDAEQVPASMAF